MSGGSRLPQDLEPRRVLVSGWYVVRAANVPAMLFTKFKRYALPVTARLLAYGKLN